MSIRQKRLSFGSNCYRELNETRYILILIDTKSKKIVVKPAKANDRDSLNWSYMGKDNNRRGRTIESSIFSAILYKLMEWDSEYIYTIPGYKKEIEGEPVLVFELRMAEAFASLNKNIKPSVVNDVGMDGQTDE